MSDRPFERNARFRGRFRVILPAMALLSCLLAGCGIGFGEGGEPGLITPAQEENPALQGKIEGRVEVEPAFLEGFLRSVAPSVSSTAGGMLAAARGVTGRLEVGILGSRRVERKALDSEGAFAFAGVPEGSYGLSISFEGRPLCRKTLFVSRRSTSRLRARFVGWDRREAEARLAVVWELEHRGKDLEWLRRSLPGGAEITALPDGTVEHVVRGGWVRSLRPDGTVLWRRDRDNDFLADEDERRGGAGGATGDDAPRNPLLVDLRLENLTRPKAGGAVVPGDLLLFHAETAVRPGETVVAVDVRVLPPEGPERVFRLSDDGGEKDLVPRWPGMQISGDERAGDGRFASILPIDRGTREMLYGSQLVFRARSRSGDESHPRFLFLHGGGDEGATDEAIPTDSLVSSLKDLSFQFRREGDRVWIIGRFDAAEPVASRLTASLIGPELRRLFVASKRPEGGWSSFMTTPALLGKSGSLLAVVASRSGQVYYAGLPVNDLEAVGRGRRYPNSRRRGG